MEEVVGELGGPTENRQTLEPTKRWHQPPSHRTDPPPAWASGRPQHPEHGQPDNPPPMVAQKLALQRLTTPSLSSKAS